MNLTEIPSKITVRLSTADKLNLQAFLRDGRLPGYHPTTADAFRIALARMVETMNPKQTAPIAKDAKRRHASRR